MDGYFNSIKRISDVTFLVRSNNNLVVIHKFEPFIILDASSSVAGEYTDCLQISQEEEDQMTILALCN